MQFKEKIFIDKKNAVTTDDGYLKVQAHLTAVGVQSYLERSITDNKDDTDLVGVLRPANIVFDSQTIETAKLKPVTYRHPTDGQVSSDNYKNVSIGHLGENITNIEDKYLGATLMITDKKAVDDVLSGKLKEISLGYSVNSIKKESGFFDGKKYEYVFDSAMKINHCALLENGQGRCGPSVAIIDKKEENEKGDNPMDGEEDLQQDKKDAPSNPAKEADRALKDGANHEIESIKIPAQLNDEDNSELISKASAERVRVLQKASYYIQDADELHALSNRDILKTIAKKIMNDDHDYSDDYLQGFIDRDIKATKEAKNQFLNLNDAQKSAPALTRPLTALDIKNIVSSH